MSVRLTALINHKGGPAADGPAQVIDRAQRAEREGYDIASYADLVVGDPFPPLMLAAQATDQIGLLTRLVGAFGRSPVHLASASAWVDRASGGRFSLGLGASLRRATSQRLGYDFDRPVARMADVIRFIRGVQTGPLPLSFEGTVISADRASVDLRPVGRVPILLAAAGPRMLRLAGALADGVLLELTTPAFIRWAMDRIREGAKEAGRSLRDFEVCAQATFLPPPGTTIPVTSTADHLAFYVRHCTDPEFAGTWDHGGVGEAAAAVRRAGSEAEAARIVQDRLFPDMAIDCRDPASLWRWFDGHQQAGVTLFAVPLEMGDLTGIGPAEVRARYQ